MLISGFLAFFLFLLFAYYVTHLQTDPITKRTRFIIFTKEQQDVLAKITLELVRLKINRSLLSNRN